MKKLCSVLLALGMLLALSGCGQASPTQTADGQPWEDSWVQIGGVLGAEEPGNGFTLLDNNDALSPMEMYYTTWTYGEPSAYTNEDGEETDLYDAQLYLLLDGCETPEEAEAEIADWLSREKEQYTVTDAFTDTFGGQDYTCIVYQCGSDTNPYARGISGFGVYQNEAISVELTCRDTYTGDEQAVLTAFLQGLHYSAVTE